MQPVAFGMAKGKPIETTGSAILSKSTRKELVKSRNGATFTAATLPTEIYLFLPTGKKQPIKIIKKKKKKMRNKYF